MNRNRLVLIVALLLGLTFAFSINNALALAPFIQNQKLEINENSPNGTATSPSKVQAIDPEGTPLTYTLLPGGTGNSVFSLSSTGNVTVINSSALDYETTKSFTLQVQVMDGEGLTNSATVTVEIKDVSDVLPVMNDQTFSVPENSPAGTNVGRVVVTDVDTNEVFNFSSLGGTGSGVFSLDSSDGDLVVAPGAQLDAETTASYNLTVKVTDKGGQSDTAVITINVTNVNEPPKVSNQVFTTPENTPNGTVIGTIAATDPENNTMTFSVIGPSAFAVNSATGAVSVSNSAALDFETTPTMGFDVRVTDQFGAFAEATMTVNLTDVNDPPKTSGIDNVVVNESAPPKIINLHAAFSDDDNPDSQLTYTLTQNSNPALFTSTPIDNAAGTLTLNFAPGAGGISNMTVRATDPGGKFAEASFKVDINDAPTTGGIPDVTVNEDAPNTTINLNNAFDDAEDPDSALIFAVVNNTNPGLFNSVQIQGANLVLDYADNVNGKATITVQATDTGGLSVTTDLKVTVNAVNDPPTTTGIADVTVDEDAPDTVINLFSAFDDIEDADNELTYAVVGNDNAALFNDVVVNSGAGTLTLKYKPNTSGVANLTVRATDKGGLSVQTNFKVTVGDVNDPPTVSNFSKSANEDEPITFSAADFADRYNDPEGAPMGKVRIVSLPANGSLKLDGNNVAANQEIAAADLDKLVFTPNTNWDGSTFFQWNASDGELYAAQPARVNITVSGTNDPPTAGNFNKSGNEDSVVVFSANDFIAAFSDADGDSLTKIRVGSLPANGVLTLNSSPVNANDQINVANLGQLRFRPDPDWFGVTTFEWNGYDGGQYGTAPGVVTITINDVNDPPQVDLNGPESGTGYSAVFNTSGGPTRITSSNLTLTDSDDTEIASATIIIVNRKNGTAELLAASKQGTGITVSFNKSNGVLTLTGPDTIANFEKVLQTVTYQNTSVSPNPITRRISFRVNDGADSSPEAIATVRLINPRISLSVSPEIQTVISGTTAVFTVAITNTGDVDLENIVVNSPNVPDCNRTFNSLAAGRAVDSYACVRLGVTARIDNEIVVTARDVMAGGQVSDSDTAIVRVSNPNILVDVSPDPEIGDTVLRGQEAKFDVLVLNPSQTRLKNVEVKAFVKDLASSEENAGATIPAPACDRTIGDMDVGAQQDYECSIPNTQKAYALEVVVTGLIEGSTTEVDDFDIIEIHMLALKLDVAPVPFEILAGQTTTVQFNVTLSNEGSKPLTLRTLQSLNTSGQPLHGNLLDPNNPAVSNNSCAVTGDLPTLPANGGDFSCFYQTQITGQPPSYTAVIRAGAEDVNGNGVSVEKSAIITVSDAQPLEVILSASPPSLVAPGGDVTLTVQVKNNLGSGFVLQTLTESVLGNLNGKGSCQTPKTIDGSSTYTCTYVITIEDRNAGDTVTRTVTAAGGSQQASGTVAIRITEFESRRVGLPYVVSGAVAGEPNNSVCSAMPIEPNSNHYFLPDDSNDWYQFELKSPARLTLNLSNYMPRDGQIILYTGACTAPTFVANNGNFEQQKVIETGVQPAGRYFIWVLTDENFSTTAPYTLRVETRAP